MQKKLKQIPNIDSMPKPSGQKKLSPKQVKVWKKQKVFFKFDPTTPILYRLRTSMPNIFSLKVFICHETITNVSTGRIKQNVFTMLYMAESVQFRYQTARIIAQMK